MNAAPRVLAVIDDLLSAAAPGERGALWHLAEPGRELDANLVRLPPGAEVGEHQEDVLDVLLVVLEGAGRLAAGGQVLVLAPGTVLWLPRTSRRALAAGPDGLAYLTVHRRRPGLAIK
ncbi:cupin domain-containing protein, partial [Streptomyces sp. SID4931]|nr:cupin domain-containing protein [Streptomyces sp. SID4931]